MLTLGSELSDVLGELALEVGSLVLRDSVLRSEAVEHSTDFAECLLSLSLVGHFAEVAHGVTCGLGIITVAKTT